MSVSQTPKDKQLAVYAHARTEETQTLNQLNYTLVRAAQRRTALQRVLMSKDRPLTDRLAVAHYNGKLDAINAFIKERNA